MEDKTAIDLIYDIHETLNRLETKMNLLEKDIKILNDKANGKLMEAIGNMSEVKRNPMQTKEPVPEVRSIPKQTKIGPDRLQQQENIKVFGKFTDTRKKPIADIEVTILNSINKVVKQTRTNRAGEFMSFLPPGEYSAEFIKEGMAPQFRIFQLHQGQKEVEIIV